MIIDFFKLVLSFLFIKGVEVCFPSFDFDFLLGSIVGCRYALVYQRRSLFLILRVNHVRPREHIKSTLEPLSKLLWLLSINIDDRQCPRTNQTYFSFCVDLHSVWMLIEPFLKLLCFLLPPDKVIC